MTWSSTHIEKTLKQNAEFRTLEISVYNNLVFITQVNKNDEESDIDPPQIEIEKVHFVEFVKLIVEAFKEFKHKVKNDVTE